MATYAIGDVHGCLSALEALLNRIKFTPHQDTLWFTGDLVNRGPQSLKTLRFIKSLGEKHIVVLGNHDLHLLASAQDAKQLKPQDTFIDILTAPDREELVNWLKLKPLLHYDKEKQYILVHAGLSPSWDLVTSQKLAKEVEAMLQGKDAKQFLSRLYGNQPDLWKDNLEGEDRLRCIVNYFTRMRYCYADGRLELNYAGTIAKKAANIQPWFAVSHRLTKNVKIIFGHFAALKGKVNQPNLYPLDTGCSWGQCLTAMRLEDEKKFNVKC